MSTQTDNRPTAPLAATLERFFTTTLKRFFTTKTLCDVDGAMSYFAADLANYSDATLGWDFGGFQALRNAQATRRR